MFDSEMNFYEPHRILGGSKSYPYVAISAVGQSGGPIVYHKLVLACTSGGALTESRCCVFPRKSS